MDLKCCTSRAELADGMILSILHPSPDLISWCMGFLKEGARAAGRDARQIEVMAAAPGSGSLMTWRLLANACAGSRRWFPIT